MTKLGSSKQKKSKSEEEKSSRSVATFGEKNLALWNQHAFLVRSANYAICTREG